VKLPLNLRFLVGALVVAGLYGFVSALCVQSSLLSQIADLALVLTLAALVVYCYYTYLIAKEASTPSAAFSLLKLQDSPYHFAFLLHNHCKLSLQCWCRLNATVYGQPVPLDGFYGGQTSFDVQPFGAANGHFNLADILSKVGRTPQEMKERVTSQDVKRQLYMDIEFWYQPYGLSHVVRNVKQPHYFDFAHDVLVADF
jgi:hypothetical protein